jgi:hypothetical protein
MNNVFFVPQVLTPGALLDARAKPKIEAKSKLSGVSELPFNITHIRESVLDSLDIFYFYFQRPDPSPTFFVELLFRSFVWIGRTK